MMPVRVSVAILVALGMIAYVDSVLPTLATFMSNGGFRICQDSNFQSQFGKICGTATGACDNIKVDFQDQTVTRRLLVCKDTFGRPAGCAYATSKNADDYSYATLKYNGQSQSCYDG